MKTKVNSTQSFNKSNFALQPRKCVSSVRDALLDEYPTANVRGEEIETKGDYVEVTVTGLVERTRPRLKLEEDEID